tara:strand:+ start:4811 stop:5881 length:1071 start_codon:yes stop_codon:yes gene_type:complete
MKKKKVLLGLSGGVDSSVAALLLKKAGYDVVACFMKNYSDSKNPVTGQCSYLEEKKMAQRMSSFLKIPFIFIDSEKEYKSLVIKPMYSSYKRGLTPNPDADCNKQVKFPVLLKVAKKYKCDYIATGHYAQIKNSQLYRGKDESKDQSYFLWSLPSSTLRKTLFPLGSYTKSEVRKIAKKNKFPNATKKGTVGICFVGKVDMQSFLQKKIKKKPGPIKDEKGNLLGKHQGIMYYTIGQRLGSRLDLNIKKSNIKNNKKWYIAKKIKRSNTLIVAPAGSPALKTKKVKLVHINSYTKLKPGKYKARFRHLALLVSGTLSKKGPYHFTFNRSQQQVAEGQSIVLYSGSKVVAGGEIRID